MPSVWRSFKPGDRFVIAFVLGLWILSVPAFWHREGGMTAAVYVDGVETLRIPLEEDARFVVEGPLGATILRVWGGRIGVEEAPCPHETCRKMGRMGSGGGIIVCVPNRVFLRIEGDSRDFDAITM